MSQRILLAGGGTGGHVYPALAMGDALKARGHDVHYYGDAARLEGRVAAERGYAFRGVPAAQFPRAGVVSKLKFAWALFTSTMTARRMLKEDRVRLVLGVGGYVMAPTVLAAWSLGIPTAIHESNVAPGMANKLCARVAKLILLTYAETAAKLPGRAEKITVGCPVNPKVLTGDGARYGLRPGRNVVLIVGGSLGAATINGLALALARDPERAFDILHVCGPRYYDEVKAAYGDLPDGVVLVGYEDRMGDAYAAAALVIARAGSSTLAELCAAAKPSLLIPSPNVTDNHQEANARGMERAGAALVVVERGFDAGTVSDVVRGLVSDGPRLRRMAAAALGLAQPLVAERVADLLEVRFPG